MIWQYVVCCVVHEGVGGTIQVVVQRDETIFGHENIGTGGYTRRSIREQKIKKVKNLLTWRFRFPTFFLARTRDQHNRWP